MKCEIKKMKSQEKSAIRELPVQELNVQLHACEEKLFKLRFANSISPLKNSSEIRGLKLQRARLLTWIRQKQQQEKAAVK